jgi:hypothetical protein
MIRNLKALGLALIALGAFGAIMASGASAAGERFHCEVEPCTITATSEANHVFSAGETAVVCTHAEFKGTATVLTEASQEVHPTYSGCTFLGESAKVETNNCNYKFGSETVNGHLPVNIVCTGTSKIKVVTSACTLSFGSQTTTGGVTVTNSGSGSSRTSTVSSTTGATFSKSGFLCFAVPGTTGTYTGPTTTTCYEDLGTSGAVDQDTTTYTEGKQVGCWWE